MILMWIQTEVGLQARRWDWSPFHEKLLSVSGQVTVGCYCCLVTKLCPAVLQPCGLEHTNLLCPLDFPDENTGMGCHFLLQGIFLTQRLNLRLLHWQADSLPLSHLGSPRVGTAWEKSVRHVSKETGLWLHNGYREIYNKSIFCKCWKYWISKNSKSVFCMRGCFGAQTK